MTRGETDSGAPRRPAPVLNVANALTTVRILAIPVFVCFVIASNMQRPGWRTAACLAFCLAAATDYADGWIARRWDLVTSFGKIADPIADKALTGSALVLLSVYGDIPVWMTLVILIREFGVTGLRFWVIRYAVIAASPGAKVKTTLQMLGIACCLAPLPGRYTGIGWWIMLLATVVTLVTGLDYVAKALRVRRAGQRNGLRNELPDELRDVDPRIAVDDRLSADSRLGAGEEAAA